MLIEYKLRYFNGWFGAGSRKMDFIFTLSSQIALAWMGWMLAAGLSVHPQSEWVRLGRIGVPLAFIYPLYAVCKDFVERYRQGILNVPDLLWILFDLFVMITAALGELYIRPGWFE